MNDVPLPVETRIKQAYHNEDLHNRTKENYSDWAMTTLFYALVQYIDAFIFIRFNRIPESHEDRERTMPKDPVLGPIFPEYMILKRKSKDARYCQQRFTMTQLDAAVKEFVRMRASLLSNSDMMKSCFLKLHPKRKPDAPK